MERNIMTGYQLLGCGVIKMNETTSVKVLLVKLFFLKEKILVKVFTEGKKVGGEKKWR